MADGRPRSERINQIIAREIGTQILRGHHPPGSGLKGEIEAAEARGISRTVYREAMRSLVAKGLVESRPKVGTHVRDPRHWNLLDPDVLAWMLSDDPAPDFVRDLFQLREIIEPNAAAMAALYREDEHLAAMEQALETMQAHGLAREDGRKADRNFHAAIFDAAGNGFLVALSVSIETAVGLTTHFKQKNQADPRDSLDDHRAVYRAIVDRNADGAARTSRELIRLARSDMGLAISANA